MKEIASCSPSHLAISTKPFKWLSSVSFFAHELRWFPLACLLFDDFPCRWAHKLRLSTADTLLPSSDPTSTDLYFSYALFFHWLLFVTLKWVSLAYIIMAFTMIFSYIYVIVLCSYMMKYLVSSKDSSFQLLWNILKNSIRFFNVWVNISPDTGDQPHQWNQRH